MPSGHPLSREVRREFFDRVCGGMAVVDAAQAARLERRACADDDRRPRKRAQAAMGHPIGLTDLGPVVSRLPLFQTPRFAS